MPYNQTYYFRKRKEYISILGGECRWCGSKEKLTFDHMVAKTKKYNISSIVTYNSKKVLAELKKCQVLCRSCHRKKTKLNSEGPKSWNKGNWKHGTQSAYRIGCRCVDCRKAYSVTRRVHHLKTGN